MDCKRYAQIAYTLSTIDQNGIQHTVHCCLLTIKALFLSLKLIFLT